MKVLAYLPSSPFLSTERGWWSGERFVVLWTPPNATTTQCIHDRSASRLVKGTGFGQRLEALLALWKSSVSKGDSHCWVS